MVENACKEKGVRVSVSSKQAGKIEYKGNKKAIDAAKRILGDVSQVQNFQLIFVISYSL